MTKKMTPPNIVKTWTSNVSNYYGTIELRKMSDDTYRLHLNDYSSDSNVHGSSRFAKAFIAEFEKYGVYENED